MFLVAAFTIIFFFCALGWFIGRRDSRIATTVGSSFVFASVGAALWYLQSGHRVDPNDQLGYSELLKPVLLVAAVVSGLGWYLGLYFAGASHSDKSANST